MNLFQHFRTRYIFFFFIVENEIDYQNFCSLTEDEVRELIPKIGIRKSFLRVFTPYIVEKV